MSETKTGASSRVDEDVEVLRGLSGIAEVFSTPAGDLYTTVVGQGCRRTLPLDADEFRSWLVAEFYEAQGRAPSSEAVSRVGDLFETQARFGPHQHPVFVRAGCDDVGDIWLDLGDASGSAVHVTGAGWTISQAPGVRFRRPRGLLPLPEPVAGGSLDELRPFLNTGTEEQFVLAVGWLVAALQPGGPFPVLVLEGEQGSAKSLTSRILRRLIDPNQAELRSEPTNRRDLAIAAGNALIAAFDNISTLRPNMSDALCCLATGGGFSTRRLYTDNEEVLFEAKRPCLLNGITYVATRGDLSDRAISLRLPVLENYREERELLAAFESARPGIMGALLTATSAALVNAQNVRIAERIRMMDAATWVTAAEEELPWEPGAFVAAWKAAADRSVDEVLDSELIVAPLMALLAEGSTWEGTASELLDALRERASEHANSSRYWPSTPRSLSSRLKRLAPDLRKRGIEAEWTRGDSRRLISLSYSDPSVTSVMTVTRDGAATSFPHEGCRQPDDDGDANDDGIGYDEDWPEGESFPF